MILLPPRSTLTDTLFPYTTLFRSPDLCRWLLARQSESQPARLRGRRAGLRVPFGPSDRHGLCPQDDQERLCRGASGELTAGVRTLSLCDGHRHRGARATDVPPRRLYTTRSAARRVGKEWLSTCSLRWPQ